MSSPIDTAYVEIQPDLNRFAVLLKAKLDAAFKSHVAAGRAGDRRRPVDPGEAASDKSRVGCPDPRIVNPILSPLCPNFWCATLRESGSSGGAGLLTSTPGCWAHRPTPGWASPARKRVAQGRTGEIRGTPKSSQQGRDEIPVGEPRPRRGPVKGGSKHEKGAGRLPTARPPFLACGVRSPGRGEAAPTGRNTTTSVIPGRPLTRPGGGGGPLLPCDDQRQ